MMLFKPKWQLLDINIRVLEFLLGVLVCSEGYGYNSDLGIQYLRFWLGALVGNRRDGYNRESGRHTIYHFFLSLRFAIKLSYA
jgi:hypothetical protein